MVCHWVGNGEDYKLVGNCLECGKVSLPSSLSLAPLSLSLPPYLSLPLTQSPPLFLTSRLLILYPALTASYHALYRSAI